MRSCNGCRAYGLGAVFTEATGGDFLPILKAGKRGTETHANIVNLARAVLGDNELGKSANVPAIGIFSGAKLVLGSVDKAYHIGILLYGTRLAQVAELRALVLGALELSVKLGEGDDGYIKFLGELLERARNHTYLLLARAKLHARSVHELEVVNDNHFDLFLADETTRLGAKFKDGKRRGVVDVQWCAI